MTYKKLFEDGVDFQTYTNQGTTDEIQAVAIVNKQLENVVTQINKDCLAEIKNDVHILIVGEMWCPDCQLNITAINAMSKLQAKIKTSIISRAFAEENLLSVLELEQIKIPLVIILDKNYQFKDSFIERPKTVITTDDFSQIKDDYFAGLYLNDTISEIVEKING